MISVQKEDFNVAEEMANLQSDSQTGAVCSFVGLVRGDGGISGLTLEYYAGMTEKQLEKIEQEARKRWSIIDVRIIHRYGYLPVGAQIVLILTSSSHRESAFAACGFLIDWLKTKAPFWKLEHGTDGDHWVAAKESDNTAADKW